MLGWPEIILIFAVILLIFGPNKLPEMAKALGSAMRDFKKVTDSVQQEVKSLDTTLSVTGNELISQSPNNVPNKFISEVDKTQQTVIKNELKNNDTNINEIAKILGIGLEGKSEEQIRNEIMLKIGNKSSVQEVH